MTIKIPHEVFNTVAIANSLADELNATDDWEYIVNPDPNGTGRATIDIFDEYGEFIERM